MMSYPKIFTPTCSNLFMTSPYPVRLSLHHPDVILPVLTCFEWRTIVKKGMVLFRIPYGFSKRKTSHKIGEKKNECLFLLFHFELNTFPY